jgi:hypothetical protein
MVPLGVFSVAREPVTLVHPIGIRTWGELGFKLPLWRLTFQNYTKSKKYEALKKNAVSRRQTTCPPLSSTVWSLERPNFIEGFAAISSMEKADN